MSTTAWQPQQLTPAEVRYSTWIAFFAWTFAVYDFILFGTLLPVMGEHFSWSAAEQAGIATWVALGGAVVAFAIGPVVDRLGRRVGIMLTIGGAALCSLLTALTAGAGKGAVIGVRSLAGLGYAEEGVNAVYLTEVYAASTDPKFIQRRGFIYSLVQSGWPVGALIAAGLTALLLPRIGWQGCFVFAAIPALVVAVLARKLKESPQFQLHYRLAQLRKAGQEDEARQLAQAHGIDYGAQSKAGLASAFKGEARRATLVLSAALFLNWFSIQVFSVLGTTVIVSVHRISFQNSLWILVLSNAVGFCGYLFHGWLGDRIGRRNTVAIGWMCGGAAFTAMVFAPSEPLIVVALYSLGCFFNNGPYSALLFFLSESYPTHIRATGGAIVHAMGPIGAVVAGLGITSVLASGGEWMSAAIWFGALPCFLSGLVMLAARHVRPESIR